MTGERNIVREAARYWWSITYRASHGSWVTWLVVRPNMTSITTVGVLLGVMCLISGILLILLAFWVSGSDRVYALAQRTYLILFWAGFFALIRGFSQVGIAFSIRHAVKEAATGLSAAA